MRPRAIVVFERLYLATLALGLIQIAASWRAERAMASAVFLIFVLTVSNILLLAMILFTSRGRSNVAKWLLVIGTLGGLPFYVKGLLSGASYGFPVISWLQAAMQLIALGLLFTPASRSWFRSKSGGKIVLADGP